MTQQPCHSGMLLALVLTLAVVLFGIAGCGRGTAEQQTTAANPASYEGTPVEGKAPDFQLVDQHGQLLRWSDVRGKVVVLSFMDSDCHDICPLTAQQLKQTEQTLSSTEASKTVFLAVNVNAKANAASDVAAAT